MDPRQLDEAYRAYADRLFAYAVAMVGDRDNAADVVQETFLLAAQHFGQLRDPAKLRSWLYAIARHVGLRHLRLRAKIQPVETFADQAAEPEDPLAGMRDDRITELVWAAYAGMPAGDREIIELSVRHGLSSTEIAATLDVSVKHANARISRARTSLADSLGVLLVARSQSPCPDLAELLAGWQGTLHPLLRKRLQRHISRCGRCGEIRDRRMNPVALLSGYATLPFAALPFVGTRPDPEPPRWDGRTGFPTRRKSRAPLVAAGLLLLAACAGVSTILPGAPTPLATSQPQATSSPVPMVTGPPEPELMPPSVETSRESRPPSPAKPSPAAPSLPPLLLDTQVRLWCQSDGRYQLAIGITANAPLQEASLRWRTGGAPARSAGVTLTPGRDRGSVAVTGPGAGRVRWWLTATAVDGRTLRTDSTSSVNPC